MNRMINLLFEVYPMIKMNHIEIIILLSTSRLNKTLNIIAQGKTAFFCSISHHEETYLVVDYSLLLT